MIHFEHPQLLWLLLLVGLLSVVFVLQRRLQLKRLETYVDRPLKMRLTPDASRRRPVAKFALLMLALALLVVAWANPQRGVKMVKGEQLGADIAICMDVSNSMMAEDIQPNRLERSKRAVNNLLGELGSDRVSLVVFAGSSYIQMPLTSDYSAARMFVDQIDCRMVSTQGTAIGDAIGKAMESFGYGDEAHDWTRSNARAIIIISDGENHEDDAVAMAQKAAEEGISVNTIGMGTPQGTPIPEYRYGQMVGYKKNRDGQTITTQLNEAMLAQIAHAGNGVYVRAGNINSGLSDIVARVNSLDKTKYGESLFAEYESLYFYPLALALLCLLAELLILEKRNPRLRIGQLLRKNNVS
ncbi:MAG: VWA domain-containing protein [Bacteroidales bacterium]|nr:VWA domain-containing protein [Bacteroidales bacterium]